MNSLIKNSIFNFIYRGLNILFPLLSAAYTSRVLQAEGVGEVSFAQNIVSYFVLFAGLGLANYGTKEIGKYQSDQSKYSQVFWELFIINTISTTICTLAYYMSVFSLNYFNNSKVLYIVVGLSLVFNYFQIDWFYQGIEEFQYIAIRSIVTKLVFLVALFAFVKTEQDVISYALISVLGTGINYIFNIFKLKKYIKFSREIFKNLRIKHHIKPAIILLASTISIQLYTRVDTTMLGVIKGNQAVGFYTYAVKISDLILNLAIAVIMILLPRLSLYYYSGKIKEFKNLISFSMKLIVYVTLPITVGLWLVAEDAVRILFGNEFLSAVTSVRILSFLIIVKSVGYLYGTQVLMTVNQEKELLLSTIFGAVTNVGMNAFLIPYMSQDGAAIASVISELLVMIIQMFYASKYVNSYFKEKKFYFSTIISTIVMAFIVLLLNEVISQNIVRFFASIFAGGLTYLIISFLGKNDILLWGISEIKKMRN